MNDRDTFAIIQPGADVEIGPEHDSLSGTVLCVSIRENRTIQYEVVWWLSGRNTAWLSEHEVRPKKVSAKHYIGFHGGQQ